MEILAPAGNREALERAQAAGADSVYLGFAAFSARAGAGNFDEEALREAICFAHLHHMRVYVTVNTLIKDAEIPEAEALLSLLEEVKADGVLVQDAGILRLIRGKHPALRVHASTQMAIHNATGVRWCRQMGMTRAVLARECSLEEIRKCAEAGLEIEVFGHGAQCVSVSGECLFSSMVGERSGNRGRCAQPCRKMYEFDGKKGAWLSPRDLCLRDDLPALEKSGAVSLKMEGRLKRPEYVFTVTDSYRRAMDSLARGAFQPAGEAEMDALKQMFHRGFMRGYAFGAEDAAVIRPESVNHRGLPLGEVTESRGNLCRVRVQRDLRDGDGLRIISGGAEAEYTYAGPEVPSGGTAVLRLRPGSRVRAGDSVWRLTDAKQLREAMAAPLRQIPVEMTLEAWPGKPLTLRVSDGESQAEAIGETVESARTRETSAEDIRRQLDKTGGTDFTAREITVRTAGAFAAVSACNSLRREALEALAKKRTDRFEAELPGIGDKGDESRTGMEERRTAPVPENLVILRNGEQAEAARRTGVTLAWYPEDFRQVALEHLAKAMAPEDWLRLPEVCEEDTLQALRRFTEACQDSLGGVLLGSIGQLGVSWPVPVGAGPGIPVMNREAALLLKEQGCCFAFASPELSGAEMKRLRESLDGEMPLLAPIYGRTQLMLLHHCPARTALGMKNGHSACGMCDRGDPACLRGKTLKDEGGRSFPLQRLRLPEGCLVRLLNMLPTDLGDKEIPGPWAAEMATETGEETGRILESLIRGERSGQESTRGHWKRPVL